MGFWSTFGKIASAAAPAAGPWGSLISQGIGLGAGALAGKYATKSAMERSPEEKAALAGATGAAGQSLTAGKDLLGQGKALTQQGQNYMQGPGNYYQTLLSGNRAAMSNLTAPLAAQISGNYRGAERGLERSGVRGAARDVAAGELNRERGSKISGLTTGVQASAAEGLAGLSQQAFGAASPMYGAGAGLMANSGNIYGNLLNQGAVNREYGRKEGEKTATAIGGFARDVGELTFGKGGGGIKAGKLKPQTRPGGIIPTGGITTPPFARTPSAGAPGAGPYQSPFAPARSPWDNVSFG